MSQESQDKVCHGYYSQEVNDNCDDGFNRYPKYRKFDTGLFVECNFIFLASSFEDAENQRKESCKRTDLEYVGVVVRCS